MVRTKKTIRRLPPETRKFARAVNDLDKAVKRISRLIPKMADLEFENLAWTRRQDNYKTRGVIDPLSLDPMQASILSKATK